MTIFSDIQWVSSNEDAFLGDEWLPSSSSSSSSISSSSSSYSSNKTKYSSSYSEDYETLSYYYDKIFRKPIFTPYVNERYIEKKNSLNSSSSSISSSSSSTKHLYKQNEIKYLKYINNNECIFRKNESNWRSKVDITNKIDSFLNEVKSIWQIDGNVTSKLIDKKTQVQVFWKPGQKNIKVQFSTYSDEGLGEYIGHVMVPAQGMKSKEFLKHVDSDMKNIWKAKKK